MFSVSYGHSVAFLNQLLRHECAYAENEQLLTYLLSAFALGVLVRRAQAQPGDSEQVAFLSMRVLAKLWILWSWT